MLEPCPGRFIRSQRQQTRRSLSSSFFQQMVPPDRAAPGRPLPWVPCGHPSYVGYSLAQAIPEKPCPVKPSFYRRFSAHDCRAGAGCLLHEQPPSTPQAEGRSSAERHGMPAGFTGHWGAPKERPFALRGHRCVFARVLLFLRNSSVAAKRKATLQCASF